MSLRSCSSTSLHTTSLFSKSTPSTTSQHNRLFSLAQSLLDYLPHHRAYTTSYTLRVTNDQHLSTFSISSYPASRNLVPRTRPHPGPDRAVTFSSTRPGPQRPNRLDLHIIINDLTPTRLPLYNAFHDHLIFLPVPPIILDLVGLFVYRLDQPVTRLGRQ